MYVTFLDLNKCPLRGPQAGRGATIQEPNQTKRRRTLLVLQSNPSSNSSLMLIIHVAQYTSSKNQIVGVCVWCYKKIATRVITYNNRSVLYYFKIRYIILYVFSSAH